MGILCLVIDVRKVSGQTVVVDQGGNISPMILSTQAGDLMFYLAIADNPALMTRTGLCQDGVERRLDLLQAAGSEGFIGDRGRLRIRDVISQAGIARSQKPRYRGAEDGLCRLFLEISVSGDASGLSGWPAPFPSARRAPCACCHCAIPGHIQRTVAYFMSLGHYDALINKMKTAYRRRRQVMEEAIAEAGLTVAGQGGFGGSSFWMRAP